MNKIFDKQRMKENYRQMIPTLTEEQIDNLVDKLEIKSRTLKEGENVIHLEYFGGLLNDNDIIEIESILAKSNFELSRYDKSGLMYAALEDFMLQVALFIGDRTTNDLIKGIGSNLIWDVIKSSSFYIWKKVHKKSYIKTTVNKTIKKKINFGIKISLDKNTVFEFKLDGNYNEELTIKALDKILDFIKQVKPNISNKPPDFLIFDAKNEKWQILDILKEIEKTQSKSNKNKGSH